MVKNNNNEYPWKFDLNIHNISRTWDIAKATIEIIANAMDEQLETNSDPVQIYRDEARDVHIRDFGRGLKLHGFVQTENEEKIKNPKTQSQFGIGLKLALATFIREGVGVHIKTGVYDYIIDYDIKMESDNIITLHVFYKNATDPTIQGTDFILSNLSNSDIQMAEKSFMCFANECILEETNEWQILEKKGDTARIYMAGSLVAENKKYFFSYNIKNVTEKMKTRLNMNKTNVGQMAYSGKVSRILKECTGKNTLDEMIIQFRCKNTEDLPDDLRKINVQEHLAKIIHSRSDVVFITKKDRKESPDLIDEAERDHYEIIDISEKLHKRISGKKDYGGKTLRNIYQFLKEYHQSFKFKFIPKNEFTLIERENWDLIPSIIQILGLSDQEIPKILISETMRRGEGPYSDNVGLYDPQKQRIILKRSQLQLKSDFLGTLCHELAHYTTGKGDVSREFELELTRFMGLILGYFYNKELSLVNK